MSVQISTKTWSKLQSFAVQHNQLSQARRLWPRLCREDLYYVRRIGQKVSGAALSRAILHKCKCKPAEEGQLFRGSAPRRCESKTGQSLPTDIVANLITLHGKQMQEVQRNALCRSSGQA